MGKTLTILVAMTVMAGQAHAGGCQQFFVKHHAYHAVQAVVAVPLIYSTVSPSLVNEAQIRAIAREELRQELRAALTAPQQVHQQPAAQQVQQQAYGVLAQKCARCHGSSKPKGDKVVDGKTPVSNDIFIRTTEMLGAGIDVPDEMKQVIASMSPAEKGQALDEMIPLRRAWAAQQQQPAKQEPEFVPPAPDGGLR